jgi:L-lactate dehydrogenase complex protein LldF
MNHCPVYGAVGGHAYGWVYPGPMGAVLTPSLIGVEEAKHLPNASTFCGKCESVCPMRIPLPKMMRHYREREWRQKLGPRTARVGLGIWAWFAKRPPLYHFIASTAMAVLHRLGRKHGSFFNLPLAGGWTATREFPAPEGKTFQELWWERQRAGGKS